MTRLSRSLFAALFIVILPIGCFKPSDVVIVDRATALEQQASGSFADLERRLARAGVAPRPVPFTPAELEALGIAPAAMSDSTEMTTADRVDALLVEHCVGEARDGRLVDTHESCKATVDREDADALIDRVNRARIQLWRWMQEQKAGSSVDEMRRGWREIHAQGVVCGGWIEIDEGRWESKAC